MLANDRARVEPFVGQENGIGRVVMRVPTAPERK